MQLSLEAYAPVRIRSTDCGQVARRLEEGIEKYLPSLSVEVFMKRGIEIIAERDDLLLRLSDYKVLN